MGPETSPNPRGRRPVTELLASIARRSHGVVCRRELLAIGIREGQIKRRIRSGSLIRVHRGVYRVGHTAPSMEATYAAAVKACGEGALLAGRAAGRLHRLFRGPAPPPEVLTAGARRVRGIRTRRVRGGELGSDAATARGIPVTSVARTIVDLAAVLDAANLARAMHQASVIHGLEPDEVEAILDRRHNWPGARRLRAVLRGDVPVTLSRLESRFLERLEEDDLPPPQSNNRIDGRHVDCRWPERGLTVELDSYRYHNSRYSWERDRAREREARARGDEFRRYTYEDVFRRPGPMLDDLRRLLRPDLPR